jgi:hypothetical protein
MYGCLCPTYESASTRRFQYGRVDSIRASHPEALAWTQAMLEESKSKDDKKILFRLAISKQTKVMKENIFGDGVDVPLLGLLRASQELWPDQPLALSKDPTYDYANKFKMSTSQVPINLKESYMGYGAVVPDGYGVSYNLKDDEILFAICSFFSCESTCSRRFSRALTKSLNDLKLLFTEETPKIKIESPKKETQPTEEPKEESKEEFKEDPRADPKDEPKEEPKKESKEDTKDEPKEEPK